MIRYIERHEIDIIKYDVCIEQSLQANIAAFSWYLDIVCDNWGVLVLNDYEAVMPIPWRQKFFIKYVYPPLWLLQLGVFSKNVEDENEFLIELLDDYKFVELRLNKDNSPTMFTERLHEKKMQVISLQQSYETIFNRYNRNRKRELSKAKKYDLIEKWNDNPNKLIEIFKQNVGSRISKITNKDYDNLLRLMNVCLEKKVGELVCVYDKNNKLVSSAFFLKYKDRVTELVCSSDFSNRKNGANTFMNDRAIFKYQRNFKIFDFGGSSMKNIRKYYLSFGATDEKYYLLKQNKLPKYLKLLKKLYSSL